MLRLDKTREKTIGGVADSVVRERFFYRIIDITDFLYKKEPSAQEDLSREEQ